MKAHKNAKEWFRTVVADGPLHRPWLIALELCHDVERANLLDRAGTMAYMTLSSVVPSLAAIFAVVSMFEPLADPKAQWFTKFRSFVLINPPPDT